MSLYPNIINVKKSDIVINTLIIISEILCASCILINSLITPNFKWSLIVILGVVYSWITVYYAVKRTINIASHVLLQTVAVSAILFLLDVIIGYRGWSISIGLPIAICAENITMLVLTIVTRKKYFKYALYQILALTLNTVIIVIIAVASPKKLLPISLTSITSIITLIMAIALCGKDLKEELKRFFHL